MGRYESLTHPTMGDLEIEDRWLKFFTKRSLIGTIAGIFVAFPLAMILIMFGLKIPGLILLGVFGLTGFIICTIKRGIEAHREDGGGLYLYAVILRIIVFRLGKVVYLKRKAVYTDEFWEDSGS